MEEILHFVGYFDAGYDLAGFDHLEFPTADFHSIRQHDLGKFPGRSHPTDVLAEDLGIHP